MSDPTAERATALIAPTLAEAAVDLYDIEYAGGVLRVVIDRPGGVDLEAIASVTRSLSRLFDEHEPVAGHYTLEVSSPGLERRLRTPTHFAGAVGDTVKLKLRAGAGPDRRLTGVVLDAGPDAITLRVTPPAAATGPDDRQVALDDIQQARTVFEWQATPKQAGVGASSAPGPSEKKAAS